MYATEVTAAEDKVFDYTVRNKLNELAIGIFCNEKMIWHVN